MKNANLKKRVLATMVSATVAFGGVAVAAPSADADIRITSQYSQLTDDDRSAAVKYNQTKTVNREMNMMDTTFGPGWCIDAHLPVPQGDTQYEVRKLDGTSGFYGFNGNLGGDLNIHPDIEKAAINLTKSMLDSYNAGNNQEVQKKNFALQALVSNNLDILDLMRGYIRGNATIDGNPPRVTTAEFLQWTGFQIGANYQAPEGQSKFYLVKNDQAFSKLNVKGGEYVTVLVPKTYNVHQNLAQEPTNQRIIIIAQPGLDGYAPEVPGKVVETKTVTPEPTTVTETVPGSTVTITNRVVPVDNRTEHVQPTVTKTEYVQPVENVTSTVQQPDVTVTSHARPEITGVTETYTRPAETVTETVTLPQQTVTVRKSTPVVTTVTETVKPTVTETAPDQTAVVTETAEPVYETVTVTGAPTTSTVTETAAAKTETSTVRVTKTNVKEVERTSIVERYYRHYNYAFDFYTSGKEQQIPVEKLGDWKIEFVDDANGLVKVEKKIVDGKAVLNIVPVKEGRGTVRVIVVDEQGNRSEFTINVVNEKTEQITVTDVTQNNHYFNVGVADLEHTIPVPEGWDYEIVEGGNAITTEEQGGNVVVKTNEGVKKATATIRVFDKTGNENNYIFNIDAADRFTQTRVIGNANSYKLEVDGVTEEPKVVKGGDLIEKIEKGADGYWVITPKSGMTGEAVITAVDGDGNTHTFTLVIKDGTNVLVDVQTYRITEGGNVEVNVEGDDFFLEPADKGSFQTANWDIQETDSGYTIVNKTNDTATFNLYKKDPNAKDGRIIVGVYTVVAKPQEAEDYTPPTVTQDIVDRNTLTLTLGDKDRNSIEITEGEDNVTVVDNGDGTFSIMPKPGFTGTVKITENAKDGRGGTRPVAYYVINVTEGDVEEKVEDAKADSLVRFSGVKDGQELRVVEGENLIDWDNTNLKKGEVYFVPGADGRVVIENLNSRDLPFQRFIFNVTPVAAKEETINLEGNSSAQLTIPAELEYEVTGDDIFDVVRDGNQLTITPKDGAKAGTSTIVVKKGDNVYYRYTLNYTPREGGDGQSTINNDFKISADGSFKIIRVNDNGIKVISGGEWVNEPKEVNGEWILTPKGPESVGKTVTVVETRGDVIVKRHNITITPEPTPLKFTEERRVVVESMDGRVIPGEGNTIVPRRGYDAIFETKELPGGGIEFVPQPNKTGVVYIDELDRDGNPVRVIELEAPASSEGSEAPVPDVNWTGNKDKGYEITVTGGANSVEINLCNDAKCTNPKRLDDKYVKVKDGKLTILPGAPLDGVDHIELVPIHNGIVTDVTVKVPVTSEGAAPAQGSSELDGKCIASIVGLSAPLLLAIPLGILSQVQIPGLEGVSAQINGAIREANDRIQRGLGIYDEDRARRAAGFQGAFNVQNPEMLGMAAGSLAAITLGLLIVDGVMRACGQEEMTSSYKIGEATGSEFLMHGSSGKPAESAKPESEGSAKDETASSKK